MNQFVRHLFDSIVENEDDYKIMGVRQTRRNTSIARWYASLQVNERLDLGYFFDEALSYYMVGSPYGEG